MNSERLAVLFLCFLVSACSTTPSRTALSVKVATESVIRDCELLGEVTGSSSHAGIARSIGIPRAKNEARERAAAMGATHIIWSHIESWGWVHVTGLAYKCRQEYPYSAEARQLQEDNYKHGKRPSTVLPSPLESVPKGKLAVMDLKAKHGVKGSLAEGLSVVVRDAIQDLGHYEVLSKEDVEVIANRTAITQSLGCDDTKCLIDIGRSLGTKFMVAGAISKFGETYNVSLRLIDTMGERAGVKKRINRNCKCAEDELIEIAKVVASLLLE